MTKIQKLCIDQLKHLIPFYVLPEHRISVEALAGNFILSDGDTKFQFLSDVGVIIQMKHVRNGFIKVVMDLKDGKFDASSLYSEEYK